jgi:hypothetical protein
MRTWLVSLLASSALLLPSVLVVGCAPGIGDPCSTALNCSITGERVCDTSQPGGACIIFGCEEGTCPPESVCVRWRPMASRLEFNACMRRCGADGDCRVGQGYSCESTDEVVDPSTGAPLAEIVDAEPSRFCVATEPPSDS